jgi:hypothetical protein
LRSQTLYGVRAIMVILFYDANFSLKIARLHFIPPFKRWSQTLYGMKNIMLI